MVFRCRAPQFRSRVYSGALKIVKVLSSYPTNLAARANACLLKSSCKSQY